MRWKYPAAGGSRSLVLLGVVSTVCDAVQPRPGDFVAADLADGGVQPDGVVLGPDPVELEVEFARVADLLQVRPFALDVPEQGLYPGLVLRGVRAAELLGVRHPGHELAGGDRAHLRAVVADGQQ